MPFTYLEEDQAPPKVSSKFTYIDDTGKDDIHGQSLKNMAQGQFDAMDDAVKFGATGILKQITGKGFGDRAREATAPNIPDSQSAPFDKNVEEATKGQGAQIAKQTVAGMVGDAADAATSPIGLATLAGPKIKSLSESVSKMSGEVRSNLTEQALSPEFAQSSSDFKYGHDPRRVLKDMPDVIGSDANSTQAAIQNKMQETGKAISDTIDMHPAANTKLDIEDAVTQPFDERISELSQQDPKTNAAAIKRLKTAKIGILNKFDENGNILGPQELNSMTPKEAWEYRKFKIDPITKYTGRASDDKVVNEAYQEARRNIKNTINSIMPELKPLNQDYGDLVSADDALDRFAFKSQKEGLPSLKLQDILTLGLSRWLKNPANKIRMAQFLYQAPKEQVESLSSILPDFESEIKNAYENSPSLSMAGQAGSNMATKEISTPENMTAEGGPAIPEKEPLPFGGSGEVKQEEGLQDLKPNPTESTSPIPENFNQRGSAPEAAANYEQQYPELAEKWKRITGKFGNEGIVKIGEDLRNKSKQELSESLKHYENVEIWAKANSDKSQLRDAQTMINKIKNAIAGVGKSPIGLTASTGVGIAAGLRVSNANAMSQRPKKVFVGQTFTGQASTYGWEEKGLNQKTADNDKFDPNKSFVAMSSLPLGSTVEVKDFKTGKTIVLPVKDFGPGKRTHRVVDLSKGAWKQLGYSKPGLAQVKVTVKTVGTGRRYHGKY